MDVRHIDSMGRIGVPANLRKSLNWSFHDRIVILKKDDTLILKKLDSFLKEENSHE